MTVVDRSGGTGRMTVLREALGSSRLRRILLAYFVFNVAEWANWIALLVWAFDRDGVRGASAIALVQLVPAALLAPVVAQALTRLSTGRALWVGYVAQAVTQVALGLALLVGAPYVVVAGAAALYAVAMTLTRPAHNTVVPELCETTGELTASNAAAGMTESAANVVGPLVSGLVVAVWAPGGLVVVMGLATVAAVLGLSWGLGRTSGVGAGDGEEAKDDVSSSPAPAPARAGIRDVLADPSARVLTLMVAAEYVLVGMMDILLVVLALEVLDLSEAGPGMLNSALGVGGLIGAAFTFTLIGRQRLGPALLLGALGAGLAFAASGLLSVTVPVVVLLAVSGAGKLFFDVTCRTFVQRLLPDRLLTAVFGLTEAFMMAGLAVGSVAAPLLVHLVGARTAFLVAGSFLPLVAVALNARLRRMDAASVVPADVVDLLRSVPALSFLPPRIVERMAMEATAVEGVSGEAVVTEGERGRHFFVIADGQFEVTRGNERLRTLGPGDWFGELALLRDVPRTATVTSLGPSSLWMVEREAFLASVGATASTLKAVREHGDSRYR
jgi:hypothetical protein